MTRLSISIEGDGLARFREAVDALGEPAARRAYARALTRTNATAFTGVKRALSRQTGLTQAKLVRFGGLKKVGAGANRLSASIDSTGGHVSLKEFGARQGPKGVRARPWNAPRLFPSTFIFAGTPNSGQPVAGGHVFRRTSKNSLPIERLHGPAVPRELVRDESAEAWRTSVRGLSKRVAHEVTAITRGVVL